MSIEEEQPTALIYVRLLDEGVSVMRPTLGVIVGNGIYRVLPTENYDPEDEKWEFPPGSLVACGWENTEDGAKVLVAQTKA